MTWAASPGRGGEPTPPPTTRGGTDLTGLPFLPPGASVGPSAEDRAAAAAAQNASAATLQANLALAAFEAKQSSAADPRYSKVPELGPLFAALRFVASGAGAHGCPADPGRVYSPSFLPRWRASCGTPGGLNRRTPSATG